MKQSTFKMILPISLLTLIFFIGCGGGEEISVQPIQAEESTSQYVPPQPDVTNLDERPPAIPTI